MWEDGIALRSFVLALAATALVSCGTGGNNGGTGGGSATCRDTNCANYTSQASAQAAFDADRACRADLDQDKDGIACEEPGNSVKTCSSTSSCGCSGKNKDPCTADSCCRWTVGVGCGCS